MPENVVQEFTDLEMLCKLLEAYKLLGEVFNHESIFTSKLMPLCTEKFLTQATYKLNQLTYQIAYEDEKDFSHRAITPASGYAQPPVVIGTLEETFGTKL